jgi:hypothetical protein
MGGLNISGDFSAARALQESSDFHSCIDESLSYLAIRSGVLSINKMVKQPRRKSSSNSFNIANDNAQEEEKDRMDTVPRVKEYELDEEDGLSSTILKSMALYLDLDP